MSSLKCKGNASGSGSVTIEAPNTSSTRTLTLPDADGTLATNENFTSTGIDDNATSKKVTVSDTGIDVTGTVTADGINFDSNNTRITWGGNRAVEGDTTGTTLTLGEQFGKVYIPNDVGIGMDSPNETLDVGGTAHVSSAFSVLSTTNYVSSATGSGMYYHTSGYLACAREAGVPLYLNRAGTSSGVIQEFRYNGASVGSVSVTGSSTAYNTSSDYRLKENVVPMTGAIDRLNQLKPSRFNFIADPLKTVDGFLAHEAATVVPEAISGEKDAMRDEEYEVTPATGDVFIPAVEEVTEERQVTETVETGSYVNLAGETITETTEQPVTTEVTTTVVQRQDIGGVMTDFGVEKVTQVPVMETVVTTEAVAEQILESNVVQPETLPEGAQWRETTAAVMGTRQVEDYQGVDQSKFTPLLTAALQEAITKIESLEARVATLEGATA